MKDDRTGDLKEGDFFRFRRITVVATKSNPKGKIVERSGEHRGQRTIHDSGKCFIDRMWFLADGNRTAIS